MRIAFILQNINLVVYKETLNKIWKRSGKKEGERKKTGKTDIKNNRIHDKTTFLKRKKERSCSSWGCKESDTTERLNWTELKVIMVRSLYDSRNLELKFTNKAYY